MRFNIINPKIISLALCVALAAGPFIQAAAIQPIVVGAELSKSGKIVQFRTNGSLNPSNGRYPLAPITAVNSLPVISNNNTVVATGPATWFNASHDCPTVAFLMLCGGVESISMSSGGSGYTAPQAVWNGDGGGTGLVIGTPTMQTGVTSYTIISPGQGLTNGNYDFALVNQSTYTIGGGCTAVPATARITVADGVVAACVPMSGSPIAYGGGYKNSFSTTPLYPSGVFPKGDNVGTGAVIQCNVSTYITGIPVINGGTGFTSPPTFTITDPIGVGAVAAPIMTGPTATDVLKYSWPDAGLTTTLGPTTVATDAPITNFKGVLEGPVGNASGYRETPTMGWGVWLSSQYYSTSGWSYIPKNKYHCNLGWNRGAGTTTLAKDANFFPVSWTPGGTINTSIVLSSGGTSAQPFGLCNIVYDDDFYAGRAPAATAVTVSASGGGTVTGTPTVSVSGTTVTIAANITQIGTSSSLTITLRMVAPSDGLMHVSNIGVFPFGNTIDRTPWVPDDVLVRNLTGPGGTTPADIRFMASNGGSAGWNNLVDWSDTPPSTLDSFLLSSLLRVRTKGIAAVRNWSTDGTKPWVTTKLYSGSLTTQSPWAVSGTDEILGSYLDMTTGPLSTADNGTISLQGNGGNNRFLCEIRTTIPHGLKTGQVVSFGGTIPVLPWSEVGNKRFPLDEPTSVFVTGPDTFGVCLTSLSLTGATPLFHSVNSLTEIATPGFTVTANVPRTGDILPYEAQAKTVAAFPNTDLWLNVGPLVTHDYINQMMAVVTANLGPTNGVRFERGNEFWNYSAEAWGLEYFWEIACERFCEYAPAGQPFLTYAKGGNHLRFDASRINAVSAADLGTVAQAAWVAAGRDASKFQIVYGSQWTGDPRTTRIKDAIKSFSMPTGGVSVAPYQTIPSGQSTITTALSSAGSAWQPLAGNWPVDAWIDLLRSYIFYNQKNYDYWQRQFAALPPGCQTVCYEGSLQNMLDVSYIHLGDYLEEDMFNHPSAYDLFWCYALACQQGNPLVAGSGAKLLTYSGTYSDFMIQRKGSIMLLQIGGNGTTWRLAQSPYMPTGLGASNKYFTPQGGSSGANASTRFGWSQVNQAPGIKALVDWNAGTFSSIVAPR